MKKLLAFVLVSFVTSLWACEVTLPARFVLMGGEVNLRQYHPAPVCPEKTLQELQYIIGGLEGKISSSQLVEMMNQKGYAIQIQPHTIHIQQFKTLIREQLTFPVGVQIKATRVSHIPGLVSLAPGDRFEVKCEACLYGMQQPLNIKIVGFDGSERTLLGYADFKKIVKAYRLLTPLLSFSEIPEGENLKEEYVEVIPHTDLITDLSVLKFYKTNKPLRAGELLKRSDLNPLNLVKAGLKTDVILENHVVRIKTQGISRSNGSIGELVEVFHPQKNKKYQGKVIDINKVLVEL